MKYTSLIVLLVIHLVGIVGLNLEFSRPYFELLTPVSIALTAILVFAAHKAKNASFWGWMTLVFLAGFGVEVLGVHTGIPFGNYHYDNGLGPKLARVPLMIGVNWCMLMYCCHAVSGAFGMKGSLRPLLTALLMVGMDYFIEPFAIRHDLWTWSSAHIPLSNYLAWFGISFLLAWVTGLLLKNTRNTTAICAYFILLAFFAADWLLSA